MTMTPPSIRMPIAAGAGLLSLLVAGVASAAYRRVRVTTYRAPDVRRVRTRSGNVLAYRERRTAAGLAHPVVVFEAGHQASEATWHWVEQSLAGERDLILYSRAGYAASAYLARDSYVLQHSVDDLIDLITAVAPGRQVILVGHSLGGYLVSQAAPQLGDRLAGVVLVDPTHIHEIAVSEAQREGARMLDASMRLVSPSMRLGLGVLLDIPAWITTYPPPIAAALRAEMRDHGAWLTAKREWTALHQLMRSPAPEPPHLDAAVHVIAAGRTLQQHPHQGALFDDYAARAPSGDVTIIDDADHLSLLADPVHAARVAASIAGLTGGAA